MKSVLVSALVASALLASGAAIASEGSDLATKSGCLGCHAVDKTVVGPSYQDVLKKRGKADAALLEGKIKNGGTGVYGQVPMPPNPAIADGDIKKLVAWVLDGAK